MGERTNAFARRQNERDIMERTLVLLKPSAVQRALIGEVISRFEKKGLRDSMKKTPVVAMCLEGVDAIEVVRFITGYTNGRKAVPGTIRGDYCMSNQQNIVHASDSPSAAAIELNRFFKPEELFDFGNLNLDRLYAVDEV